MFEPLLRPLTQERRTVALQMARYTLAGLTITSALATSYWALAELGGVDPMLSLTMAFVVFSLVSYVAHGSYSFKGHGTRGRHHVRATRFIVVTLVGFSLNQFLVWLLVKHLGGPTWWPIPPMVFITPIITFGLLRRFVYA